MQTSTRKIEYVWSDKQDRYIVLRQQKSIFWTDEVAFCKGASSQQTDLANSQQNFYNTLSNDYSTQFANQSAILSSLNNSLSPIIQAGPNQFGFSSAETNTLNSQAIQGTGQQYTNAKKALSANQAAAGGGNTTLPSGVASQQQANLASAGAAQTSNQLLGIQQAGYETGRQQYNQAVGELGSVASQYNPTGYAGQATGAGSAAAQTANEIAQENNAASPWGLIGGLLGGVAGSFAGPFGASIGSSLDSSLGGALGGGGDDVANMFGNGNASGMSTYDPSLDNIQL